MKTAIARTASWTGIDEVARTRLYRDLPFVVCYHRVVERLNANDGFALPAMEISVATLERHLDWLGRHFRIISLDDLPAELEKPAGSKPMAAITFDDGYSDIFHHAYPLLARKGIPAGVFVITDLVTSGELPMHERLHALLRGASRNRKIPLDSFSRTRFFMERFSQADLQRLIDSLENLAEISDSLRVALRPLDWEMVAEMQRAGMTIGSHTSTHPVLTNESEKYAREEVETSARELERRLGARPTCFAYPDGGFNGAVVQAVAEAGYRYAFTICRHRDPQNPMLTIPRTGMWEQTCLDHAGRFSPAIMSSCAAGLFNRFSQCTRGHA